MPAKVVSRANAEHYKWGGADGNAADGWYLVKTDQLQIIEEGMPTGTSETPHHHVHARQFFYVVEGELTMEVEFHSFVVRPGEGIEVGPGQIHRAINGAESMLRMVVSSQPPSHGDRIEDRISNGR